eukprot:Nitzschia sp. Nitz4//scaffold32_size149145//147236//147862//NITZ4_002906-RA/size149145-processed-gene-0.110-mRNA-1//1//CDS//3329548150//2586//frame0
MKKPVETEYYIQIISEEDQHPAIVHDAFSISDDDDLDEDANSFFDDSDSTWMLDELSSECEDLLQQLEAEYNHSSVQQGDDDSVILNARRLTRRNRRPSSTSTTLLFNESDSLDMMDSLHLVTNMRRRSHRRLPVSRRETPPKEQDSFRRSSVDSSTCFYYSNRRSSSSIDLHSTHSLELSLDELDMLREQNPGSSAISSVIKTLRST